MTEDLNYAIILRAIWERGTRQRDALAELDRRGIWLTPEQREQAGLMVPSNLLEKAHDG